MDYKTCSVCGSTMFVAMPGQTTSEDIAAFASQMVQKKTRKTNIGWEEIAREKWIHPGVYCPNGCSYIMFNLGPLNTDAFETKKAQITPEQKQAWQEQSRLDQIEKAKTPWGDMVCAGCERRLSSWADEQQRRCGYCHHPLPVGGAGGAGMERWTVIEPSEGLFRLHIQFGGNIRFWCEFDYSILPIHGSNEVEIELADDADADTIKWFAPLRRGMIHGIEREHEDGRKYIGILIVIGKIYAHEVDTTEYGCEYYGKHFVLGVVKPRAVLVSDNLLRRYERGACSWNDIQVALGGRPDPDTTPTTQTTVEAVEAEYSSRGYDFCHLNKEWGRLKAQMQPGDELWKYELIWSEFKESTGYKLLRDGRVIAKVTTSLR